MCGIVAAVSDRNVVPAFLEGLRRLAYRSCDSAGLAVLDGGTTENGRPTLVANDFLEACPC